MRLDINLASRPYKDVRRLLLRWGTFTALFALFSMLLFVYAIHSWRQSRDVNAQISRVQQEIRALDGQKAAAVALLNQPNNRAVVEQSRFLNSIIARKSFSWTRVFMELEQIVPSGLRVVSIVPNLGPDNQLQLRLRIAGNSPDKKLELIRRIEQSQSFRNARLESEAVLQPSPAVPDTLQFEVTAIYVPQPAHPPGPVKTPAKAENVAAPDTTASAAKGAVQR